MTLLYAKALDDEKAATLLNELRRNPRAFLKKSQGHVWKIDGDWLCIRRNVFQSEKRLVFAQQLARKVANATFPRLRNHFTVEDMRRDADSFFRANVLKKSLKEIAAAAGYMNPNSARSAISTQAARFRDQVSRILSKFGCKCGPIGRDLAIRHFQKITTAPSNCLPKLKANSQNSRLLLLFLEKQEKLCRNVAKSSHQ